MLYVQCNSISSDDDLVGKDKILLALPGSNFRPGSDCSGEMHYSHKSHG